jgi:ATP-dependent Clp protease ATP-binding subunit ClpC
MFERFTERAIKTIMLAQEEARRMGHNRVGTEQILLGLLGVGETADLLSKSGVSSATLSDVRLEVEKVIGRGKDNIFIEIPFTNNAKRLLECSWDVARSHGHDYISDKHLFLALLGQRDTVAVQVLTNLGLSLDKLRDEAERELDSPEADLNHRDPKKDLPGFKRGRILEQIKAWQRRSEMAHQQGNEDLRAQALGRKAAYEQMLTEFDDTNKT